MHIAVGSLREQFYFQNFVAEPAAIAIRAAQVNIAEKLHLNMFKPVSLTGRTTAIARVETEGAGGVAAFFRDRRCDKQFSERVEGSDVGGGCRARGLTNGALINHYDAINVLQAINAVVGTRCFSLLTVVLQQRWIQD